MRRKAVGIILVGLSAIVGCSSANTGSSGSGAPTGTKSPKPVTVGRFVFPLGQASGSTVKVGLVNSNNQIPQLASAAQAAATYVNSHFNGIAGHPIQLVVCDEKADPAAASTCTPQFVQNRVVAVIGFPLVWTSIGGLTGLASANIPYLGEGQGAAGQSAPNAFPMLGGEVEALNFVTQFAAQGIKTVNYLTVNFPASISSEKSIEQPFWSARGISIPHAVFYTSGAADVTTPAIQAMKGNPSAIFVAVGSQDIVRIVAALRQAGYKGRIFATYGALTPQLYPAAASVMNGVTSESQLLYFLDTGNPEVRLMSTILGSGIKPDSYSQMGVAQVLTLADIGNHIGGTLTGAKILDYMKNLKSQKIFMGYEMNASQIPSKEPDLAHVTNTFSRFMTYDGKNWNYSSGWVSAFWSAAPHVGS